MNLVQKALWYIESHFAAEISLECIAAVADVSRFHMSRAFGLATGQSVMRYVRGRRLTEAARALSLGAPDILSVALDSGYGSHEAFTRAFRDQFGVTPEAVRQRGDLDNLELVEPIKMRETMPADLAEPRRESGGALLIAGLRARYSNATKAGNPRAMAALWAADRRHFRAGWRRGLWRVLRFRRSGSLRLCMWCRGVQPGGAAAGVEWRAHSRAHLGDAQQ